MRVQHSAALLLVVLSCSQALGQYQQSAYYPPGLPPYVFPYSRTTPLQPLLFAKISGPAGMKVTFYRSPNQAETLDAPCTVGFRPGYIYRIALSGMKQYPGLSFYPTLTVRGSLLLGGNLRTCDYPAGLVFKDADFRRMLEALYVKKVIFVEKVENAVPRSSSPDDPIELPVPRSRDPLDEAGDRGLPVLILELGERQVSVPDLMSHAIPGTIFLPGDTCLPRPNVIPCLPWSCFPIYDPILGPAPWLYYTLPDGGDWGSPVGFDRFGRLRGLDPADTVARYKDSTGQTKIAISNRVCLCIPRFLVTRSEPIGLSTMETPFNPQGTQGSKIHLAMETKWGLKIHDRRCHLELVNDKLKASGIEKLQVTAVTGRVQNLDVTATFSVPMNVSGSPPKVVPPLPPPGKDMPLKVDKWPDCCGGVVGSIIKFYIRFTNVGQQPITNVIVSDNLISRFEYVKGTAQATRGANFTIQPNDVGSSILQWEIDGDLQPGEEGTVSFDVRVR